MGIFIALVLLGIIWFVTKEYKQAQIEMIKNDPNAYFQTHLKSIRKEKDSA